jgi:hypothetical protein
MSVYVDELVVHENVRPSLRHLGQSWCHLWADTDTELHEFAAKIGMRRSWFQPHHVRNHYDLTPRRRLEALRAGAVRQSLIGFLRERRPAPPAKKGE